ncbi:MAG: 50S ribosomal protein L24 [Christensenellales bacterium]
MRKKRHTVKVIAGNKGKEGKIITAIPADGKVIVEGVAVAKRHQKARVQGQESGIIHKEMPIDASNVMGFAQSAVKLQEQVRFLMTVQR